MDSGLLVAIAADVTATTASASASAHRSSIRGRRTLCRTSSSGVTMSTPMASPAHQAAQTGQNCEADWPPLSTWTPVPVVALMTMPPRAPRKTRATPSRSRSSCARKPTARRARKEQTGASVLPAATATPQRVSESVIDMIVSSAPAAIAGQIRRPR